MSRALVASLVLGLGLALLPTGAAALLSAVFPDRVSLASRLGIALGNWSVRLFPPLILLVLPVPLWLVGVRRALASRLPDNRHGERAAAVIGAAVLWLALLVRFGLTTTPSVETALELLVGAVLLAYVLGAGYSLASRLVNTLWARRLSLAVIVGALTGLTALAVAHNLSFKAQGAPVAVSVADLRVTRLRRERGGQWIGEVQDAKGQALELHVGSALSDGAVVSALDVSGLFVAVTWGRSQKAERRLLRFLPPQALPPITLSPETTRIVGPLLPHGTPDFGAWLNAQYSAGITRENNAAPPLKAGLAQLVDAGRTFWDNVTFVGQTSGEPKGSRIMTRPWVDDDCPGCVSHLAQNEKAMAQIAAAVTRPRYLDPRTTGDHLYMSPIPSLLPYRTAANAFAGRGMLRLGRGDSAGAAVDALSLQRLARCLCQGQTLIEHLVAVAIRGIGAPLLPAIAAAPDLDRRGARELLDQLALLSPVPDMSQAIDLGERAGKMDRLLLLRERASQRGPGSLFAILEPSEWRDFADPPPSLLYLVPAGLIDWDAALRRENHLVDLQVAVVRARTAEERQSSLAALEAEQSRIATERMALMTVLAQVARGAGSATADQVTGIENLGGAPDGRRSLAVLALEPNSSLLRAHVSWNEAEAQFRLGVHALALAADRMARGRYPTRLDTATKPAQGYILSYKPGSAGGSLSSRRNIPAQERGSRGVFALTAVPETPGETGLRSFCVDSTGALLAKGDGGAPSIVDGVCAATEKERR
jgi:hypothetical protein